MKLPRDPFPNNIPQPTLIRRVGIFIDTRNDLERIGFLLLPNLPKTILDRFEFLLCENSGTDIRASECDRSGDVLGAKTTIEIYRL